MTIDDKFREKIEGGKGAVAILAGSGSDKEHIEEIVTAVEKYKIPYEVRIISAHKQPIALANALDEYNQTDGLLSYIDIAGGTDALSGSSFNTLGPVISCPPDTIYSAEKKNKDGTPKPKPTKEFNESCLTNPPGSSNAYVARAGNAARFIAQMYSGVNPEIKEILEAEIAKKVSSLKNENSEYQKSYAKRQIKNSE